MTPLPPFTFLHLKNFSGCLYNSLKVHHIWINLGEGGPGSVILDLVGAVMVIPTANFFK